MKNEGNKLSFKEHIRKRPGMYLGAVGSKGIINLVKGLILDTNRELENEKNFFHFSILADNKFELKIKSETNLEKILIQPKEENDYSTKFHFRVLEALTDKYEITKEDDLNLILNWELNESIIKDSEVDFVNLSEVLGQVAYLNRESEILITDNTKKYQNQSYYSFPEGVRYVYERCKIETLGTPKFEISFEDKIGKNHYQIFIGYRTDWYPTPRVLSFANEVHTVCGGSLVEGIMEGLVLGCEEYVSKSNLEKFNIKRSKFDNGLILVCSVKGGEYKYGGSFKESLIDKNVQQEVRDLIKKLTLDFIEGNKEKSDKFLWRFDESNLTSGIMETK